MIEIPEFRQALMNGMVKQMEDNVANILKDNVNHPSHYTHGGIETIDYLQAKMTQEQFEGYLLGNILKYVSRYPHKNGTEDLRKAQWYINKLLEVKS